MRKGKDPEPDPGGPKTCGSCRSGSPPTLFQTKCRVLEYDYRFQSHDVPYIDSSAGIIIVDIIKLEDAVYSWHTVPWTPVLSRKLVSWKLLLLEARYCVNLWNQWIGMQNIINTITPSSKSWRKTKVLRDSTFLYRWILSVQVGSCLYRIQRQVPGTVSINILRDTGTSINHLHFFKEQ